MVRHRAGHRRGPANAAVGQASRPVHPRVDKFRKMNWADPNGPASRDVFSDQDLNKSIKFWKKVTHPSTREPEVTPVSYDRRSRPSSRRTEATMAMLSAIWTDSLKIGMPPVVRISRIGVMR
jgi:hypothetical protein